MAQILKNNVSGVLSTQLNPTDTSMVLVDASNFPAPTGGDFYLLTLVGLNTNGQEATWEVVKVTAKAINTLTVVRAQEGTTAATWPVGATVQLRLTAGTLGYSSSWAGITNKPAVIAAGADMAAARAAIGAGTSNLSDAPSDGKTYGRKDAAWVEDGGITNVSYDNRGTLRTTVGTHAVVDGLGLFVFEAGSTEPDDDESCFATSTGRWLLQAAHWDLVVAWQLPESEERDAYDDDEPLRFASSFASSFASKVLTGSATCAITSVAPVASTAFTGAVTGAAVGDRVIATPPAALGATSSATGSLSYHAWVSAANTVTVMLTNASAAAATTNAAVQTAWPVTVIKS